MDLKVIPVSASALLMLAGLHASRYRAELHRTALDLRREGLPDDAIVRTLHSRAALLHYSQFDRRPRPGIKTGVAGLLTR
jgi:hypothetical protein